MISSKNEEQFLKTWTIVQFKDENTLAAVPTNWIVDSDNCLWPPFTTEKIGSAIRNHMEPSTCWPSHRIRIFRNGTYGKSSGVFMI